MTMAHNEPLPLEIPPEANRWNWGAFLLTWVWGVGNGVFIALLVFIPFFGILIMPFVLGAKGSAWAWKTRRWDSIEHFRRVQRLWAIWGAIIWVGLIVLSGAVFGGVWFGFLHSEAYKLGLARLQASEQVVSVLGEPVAGGFPAGEINVTGESGSALLTFSVKGPKGSGQATLQATKKAGVWTLDKLRVIIDGSTQAIDVIGGDGASLAPAPAPWRLGESANRRLDAAA